MTAAHKAAKAWYDAKPVDKSFHSDFDREEFTRGMVQSLAGHLEPFIKAEVDQVSKREEHWRKVALYLADCHAANLEGLPKTTSKYQRERMKNICHKALLMLSNSWPYDARPSDIVSVQERLRRNIK